MLDEDTDGSWGWVIAGGSLYIAAVWAAACRCYSVYYIPMMAEYSVDYVNVAWMNGSFQLFYGFGGACASILFKTIGIRATVMISGLMACIACFSVPFLSQLWQVQLCMGIICGLCFGFAMVGANTTLTRYFKKRLYSSMQVMCLGLSLGPFIACPLYQILIDTYGWRGSAQILAALYLNVCISGALMRPKPTLSEKRTIDNKEKSEIEQDKINTQNSVIIKSRSESNFKEVKQNHDEFYNQRRTSKMSRRRSSVYDGAVFVARKMDLVIFKNPVFYVYIATWSFFSMAYNSTLIYLVPYAQQSLHFSEIRSTSLISALSVGEVIARVLIGVVIDRVRQDMRLNVVALLISLIGISLFLLPFVQGYVAMMCLCVILGILGGGMDGTFSAIIAEIFGLKRYSSAYGYSNVFIHGIGMATTIVLGWVADADGGFQKVFYVGCGSALMSSLCTLCMNRLLIIKRKTGKLYCCF